MNGRFLVVLRIDDRLPSRRGHIADSPAVLVGAAPAGLELFRFRVQGHELSGISDWETAILFWQHYAPSLAIDLVVADVRFDFDRTSPLSEASSDIPTGLSHLKPFASVGRVRGFPTGIGIHTADPFRWERLASGEDRVSAAMGLLAAHEAGEVAAILGQAADLPAAADQRVRWCWSWLASHTAAWFGDACRVAVRDYRSSLASAVSLDGAFPPKVMVMPRHWVSLAQWCEKMRERPRPIGPQGPAVEFVLPDGARDAIWLRSLFADVKVADVESATLPASCFAIESRESESRHDAKDRTSGDQFMDSAGMPRIGAFVRALRGMHDVVEAAWSALGAFPIRVGSATGDNKLARNLLDVLPDDGGGRLARGFGVLFQILRRDHENWQQWETATRDYAWDVRKQCFLTETAAGDALWDQLVALLRLMPGTAEFYLPEPFEGQEEGHEWAGTWVTDPVPLWAQWHVNLLVEAGALAFDAGSGLYQRKQQTLKALPLPAVLPDSDFFVGLDTKTYLMQTLGFSAAYGPGGCDNWRGANRAVRNAFALENEAAAGEFIEGFVRGTAPKWVKQICAELLTTKLQWNDHATWPRSVRER